MRASSGRGAQSTRTGARRVSRGDGGAPGRALAEVPRVGGSSRSDRTGSSSPRDRVEQPPVLELGDTGEAALLEHAHRLRPGRLHVGDDLLEAELVEAVLHARLRRLGCVPAPPAVAAEPVRQLPLRETLVEVKAAIADELAGIAFPDSARKVRYPRPHLRLGCIR